MKCHVFQDLFTDGRTVYTYGTALEADSPRFHTSGDFLTYVVFLATVILVSGLLVCFTTSYHHFLLSCCRDFVRLHLYNLPAQPHNLAEAVPGTEGDYPCTSYSPIIRNIQSRDVCGVGMVGMP